MKTLYEWTFFDLDLVTYSQSINHTFFRHNLGIFKHLFCYNELFQFHITLLHIPSLFQVVTAGKHSCLMVTGTIQ